MYLVAPIKPAVVVVSGSGTTTCKGWVTRHCLSCAHQPSRLGGVLIMRELASDNTCAAQKDGKLTSRLQCPVSNLKDTQTHQKLLQPYHAVGSGGPLQQQWQLLGPAQVV